MERLQASDVKKDLEKKMVLLSGPRQVGKSWLARKLMGSYGEPRYLNYDNAQDREIIRSMSWPSSTDLLVLDELHKMPGWKTHLKGIYDTRPDGLRILVTGSARLETFRQGGDSLAGRYFSHRLFPVSPTEAKWAGVRADLERFLSRGGFPEPFLTENESDAGRWRRQYLDSLIREDILSLENVRELRAINLLVELLRGRVGSPVSYQNLSEDLGVAPNTVKRHIEILEALYIVFRVAPRARSIARSLLQRPKLYFFDVGLVRDNPGERLENLVALCLFKRQRRLEDMDGRGRALCYLRTKDGRESDFVLVEEEVPRLIVEVKSSDRELAPGLRYFHDRYGIKGVQLVADLRQEYDSGGLSVRRAFEWLSSLEI
jgi:predicted AAA+ superfamily ATPase